MSDRKQFILVMVVAAIFVSWLGWRGFVVIRLNEAIRSDTELRHYPYPFRVLRVDGSTAVMSTLRSPNITTHQALQYLYPKLRSTSDDSPDWQHAEREFARLQARSSEIVLASPYIRHIRWELDQNWYYLAGLEKHSARTPFDF
ncbi:hypothetical protein [Mangrovitalea sediminis]|uniref:hypothetical protein n=1 Tax=Mangrovitalea sediminis TaxID=1982043 RepID=UPI000BE4EBCB|nr:hypothetical protein [Mangrovitalea sediminis]